MIAGLIKTGIPWKHWQRWEYTEALIDVHERIVTEMTIRGYVDSTPATKHLRNEVLWKIVEVPQLVYPVTEADLWKDRRDLICRWEGVFCGRETDHADKWAEIIQWYRDQGGCPHNAGFTDDRVCAICKRVRMVEGAWLAVRR
jgi:hypothetical protein